MPDARPDAQQNEKVLDQQLEEDQQDEEHAGKEVPVLGCKSGQGVHREMDDLWSFRERRKKNEKRKAGTGRG